MTRSWLAAFSRRIVPAACALALAALLPLGTASAQAETASVQSQQMDFDIAAQDAADALREFAFQSDTEIMFPPDLVEGVRANAIEGSFTPEGALNRLLYGVGLTYRAVGDGTYVVEEGEIAVDPFAGDASGAMAQAPIVDENGVTQPWKGVEEIIVTGQKREERLQDVPIAISAFSQEDLKVSQIAGGPDLHLQVPNMTFTKTNFTGYSIQIRGIGTQAISATTDPAVAVALNQTPFIRNRFFEQEFYDLERLEVLRGPQGTLFGRNATAGVVNLITAKPKFQYEAMGSLDIGNYNSRRWEGMVNLPLVEDTVALRIAGAGTKRDGYAINDITGSPIDGRDLWSSRVSLRFTPNDRLDVNMIWEHFEEDDDRLRSGKQLCKTDQVTEVAGYATSHFDTLFNSGQQNLLSGVQATFSQGCERNSLYAEDSFQTPNGIMLPYYVPTGAIGLPTALNDPYESRTQSRDLRVIESAIEPEYRARSDIGQLQISYDFANDLTLDWETAYSTDEIFSLNDFNRFNTAAGAWQQPSGGFSVRPDVMQEGPEGGIFCDPQLGCSDRLVAADVSSAESSQFSQELRLSSSFDGPFNFNLGANFLRYDTEDKYYVFINSLSLLSANGQLLGLSTVMDAPWVPGESDNASCLPNGLLPGDPDRVYGTVGCRYIDPNPIGSLNDLGHNYFLSRNPFKLISYAVFGETYWDVTDTLKLTAGLRWSVDRKEAPLHPTQIFIPESVGHPANDVVQQTWREPTGRLVVDWKPHLPFTDESLIYGSVSRGYKAGGANPPLYVALRTSQREGSKTRPQTFEAEFVNAFEVGTKNTLLGGDLTLNLAAFYYDYEGYQISELVDRSAFNKNYDAEVWGVELETDWWATQNLRLGFKGGYNETRIADGQSAIDLMDRTAGDPDWTLVRPFPTNPSSCILPTFLFDGNASGEPDQPKLTGVGSQGGGGDGGCEIAYIHGNDPVTALPYVPNPTQGAGGNTLGTHVGYEGWDPATAPNNGEGIAKDLGGNELPNAPNYTATLTGDYIIPLSMDWSLTLHTDLYWQSESWWRIFNDHEYARLDDYFTMNLAAILDSESGWNIMAYIKNVTDETAITGAFLYTDDVGLTTNAFLTEPRLYGIRVTKEWGGGRGPQWMDRSHGLFSREPDQPSPLSLELGGYLLRPNNAPAQTFAPEFITAFDPDIDPTGEQTGDLDWGDGREIVLTYAPQNGWRFSLGARFGESGRDARNGDRVVLEGETLKPCLGFACGDYSPVRAHRTNYGLTELVENEEHLLVDFMVGRDVGLGGLLEGELSAGLRYARLQSNTDVSLGGTPDWQFPEQCWQECKYGHSIFDPPATYVSNPATRNEYRGTMEARREFEGFGPVVQWEASSRLFGDENSGHVDLDWSLSGGVLFGKQRTSVEGSAEGAYFEQTFALFVEEGYDVTPVTTYATPFEHSRSKSVRVPTAGASLGLTYRFGGASIGAGYKWERYFDAIDGGIEERKEYDRTIDGPYIKVTFGGGS